MGRRPNPLILEYFERGPKLNDNSNRYPHTCKQCGENFPKGRIDSLTAHITKRCPAISESERMRACLELHGIAHSRPPTQRTGRTLSQTTGPDTRAPDVTPQGWSALETLAEASRQVDLNENNRSPDGYETQDLANNDNHIDLTLDAVPESCDVSSQEHAGLHEVIQVDGGGGGGGGGALNPASASPQQELTPEERLQALIPASEASSDESNISVAVAAAARLRSSFLDPQLVDNDDASPTSPPPSSTTDGTMTLTQVPSTSTQGAADPANVSQPWGAMTYVTTTTPSPAVGHSPAVAPACPPARGGVTMDTSGSIYNGRPRHFRSKFTPARRQEVKEVRKLGACIRCRILRKLCSKGTPCDTCRKVLSPRVWMSGCVRTRLHEQVDLYSAGVQVVLSQNRINLHKDQLQLVDVGSVVEVSHFPDAGRHIRLATLAVLLESDENPEGGEEETAENGRDYQVVLVNQERDDVPSKMEMYTHDVLGLFIEREPSRFVRITLETASKLAEETKDDLVRKALELWSLVESIDRERQWTIVEHPYDQDQEPRPITEAPSDDNVDIYTMICMQLNAAAERKANGTSKNLLNHMDRLLADSKTKVGFATYLAALIFLNCVEKSTWAFKAWEQPHLRPGWPLEREPSSFTDQGGNIAALLKMLLGIRRALPQTGRGDDGKLVALEQEDAAVVGFFQTLDMDYSRSLEMTLCSHLLLP
ncbi:hypothetical protein L249_8921 [Ophiocordyceps polyrhachis-furcata BCC 54312]|uniref:Zn(2)-C6 fungal-type domain-containing protein n=1 Tax=Ophiocordyceps polyrhachis-furcata BCC 54312 TaxID=1330021 RepID=A0A367L2V1_9HYPO|nr:hypothetical protein L249_8921 [Ophiocordyceps polyrhachis-furcata BCC 54312]